MRLFVAVEIPPLIRPWVLEMQDRLKPVFPRVGFRWTPAEQWHLTLQFLGECDERRATLAFEAMKQAARGTASFGLSLGKPGAFAGPRMGVLWLGLASGAEPLRTLAMQLREELERLGFPKEKRPFRAHLTLARSREKIPSALLKKIPAMEPSMEVGVDRVHLYRIEVGAAGSKYTILHTARLTANGGESG